MLSLDGADRNAHHRITDGEHHLSIFIDNDFKSQLSLQLDLNEVFQGLEKWDGRLYAGFTASTGRFYAEHAITEWEVYEAERPPDRLRASARPYGAAY